MEKKSVKRTERLTLWQVPEGYPFCWYQIQRGFAWERIWRQRGSFWRWRRTLRGSFRHWWGWISGVGVRWSNGRRWGTSRKGWRRERAWRWNPIWEVQLEGLVVVVVAACALCFPSHRKKMKKVRLLLLLLLKKRPISFVLPLLFVRLVADSGNLNCRFELHPPCEKFYVVIGLMGCCQLSKSSHRGISTLFKTILN